MSARRLVALQAVMVTFRLGTAMVPLAMLLTLRANDSLPLASFALALWTLSSAAVPPLWTWLAGRWERFTLILLSIASAVALLGMSGDTARVAALVLATVAGGTLPPITSLARATLASSLSADCQERAFGIEAAAASAAFIAAPLCVGLAHAVAFVAPLAACGCSVLVSSVGYSIAASPLRTRNPTAERQESPGNRGTPGHRWRRLVVAGAGVYAALACVEVTTVARLETVSYVTVSLAFWSAASLVSGLILSFRPDARSKVMVLWVLPIACLALAVVTFGNWGGRPVFVAGLVSSGVAVAPLLGALSSGLARRTKSAHHRSSYAVLQSSSWFGAAIGTAFAGVLVKSAPGVPMLFAAALTATAIYAVRLPPQPAG